MFMSFILIRLDESGLVMAAGSHRPILHYRLLTNEINSHQPTGSWLGIEEYSQEKPHYSDLSFQMSEGDILVLHTDGLTEAINAQGDHWGYSGLIRAFRLTVERSGGLDLKDMNEQIVRELGLYADDTQFEDDITLISIRKNQ